MVSIAMATYNGAKYICEQIDSILNQDYFDFELVICDDCSSDDTVKILKEYEKKDARIKLYINDTNLGYKRNFQKAITLTKGEYIALCDQDDIWMKNHISKLLSIIGENDIACGNPELINGMGESMGLTFSQYRNFQVFYGSRKFIYRLLCDSNPCQGASMLLKREFLFKKEVFEIPDYVRVHDIWFALCACMNDGLIFTFDIITKYRQHDSNATPNNHEHRSVVTKIKSMLKKMNSNNYKTDRLIIIENLQRIFFVDEEIKKIIEDCYLYQKARSCIGMSKIRFRGIKIYWKNYKYIHTLKSNKLRIIRTAVYFI